MNDKRNINNILYVTRDNSPISNEQWDNFNTEYAAWKDTYKGKTHTMEAAMLKPNAPNYFQANND